MADVSRDAVRAHQDYPSVLATETMYLVAKEEASRLVAPGGEPKNWVPSPAAAGFPEDDVLPPSLFWRDLVSPPGWNSVPRGYGYPGTVHWLYGTGGVGKTALAALFAAQELKAGHRVVWYSFEPQQGLTERLTKSGADPSVMFPPTAEYPGGVPLPMLFHHMPATGVPSDSDIDVMCQSIHNGGITLVVLDAFRGLQSLLAPGTSANDGDAVETVNQRLLVPLARAGAAILVIDHRSKDTSVSGPTGSERKMSAAGVVMRMDKGVAFNRDTDGWASVTVEKDRYAYNSEQDKGIFTMTGGVSGFTERVPSAGASIEAFLADPVANRRKAILDRLRDMPAFYSSSKQLARDLSESGSTSVSTWERDIKKMREEGVVLETADKHLVAKYSGPGDLSDMSSDVRITGPRHGTASS